MPQSCGTRECQPHWLSKSGDPRAQPSCKNWGTDVCSSSFQGDTGDLDGLEGRDGGGTASSPGVGGGWQSAPFVGRCHSAAFWMPLRGLVLCVAVHLGCPREDIRRLLCHHLGLELHVIYFYGSFLLLWRPRQGSGRTGWCPCSRCPGPRGCICCPETPSPPAT